jgi:hypothetical protein
VVVESGFLGVVGNYIIAVTDATGQTGAIDTVVLSISALLNIFLCNVWFRVRRQNRSYTLVRFEQARELERLLAGTLRLYEKQTRGLSRPQNPKHGSRAWVKHIPSAFISTWRAWWRTRLR